MGAIVAELGIAKISGQPRSGYGIAIAMVTILVSWAFVHTIFALHYAHEYYGERGDHAIGGLTFPGRQPPDYWDFLYFSLVIAMTSQVSDVVITSKVIRRIVTVHGALAFFFNVAVFALDREHRFQPDLNSRPVSVTMTESCKLFCSCWPCWRRSRSRPSG